MGEYQDFKKNQIAQSPAKTTTGIGQTNPFLVSGATGQNPFLNPARTQATNPFMATQNTTMQCKSAEEEELQAKFAPQNVHLATIQRLALADLSEEEKRAMEEEGGAIQAKFNASSPSQNTVIQRAFTGRRPLARRFKAPGDMNNRWIKDKGIFHEHIFFEDGINPPNIGFMGKEGLGQDNDMTGYVRHLQNLDDGTMRNAVANVGDPGNYFILGNNCQRYVSNVIAEYNRLRRGNAPE
ncbi:MAG: hypothetical protein MUE85_06230 [Microscillaceae bacterium]|jgi:hypothetical protein|nr:hypothetical protein [Microscillaceae bacterium]